MKSILKLPIYTNSNISELRLFCLRKFQNHAPQLIGTQTLEERVAYNLAAPKTYSWSYPTKLVFGRSLWNHTRSSIVNYVNPWSFIQKVEFQKHWCDLQKDQNKTRRKLKQKYMELITKWIPCLFKSVYNSPKNHDLENADDLRNLKA